MIRGLVNLKISKWLTFVNWYIHDLLKDNYDTITYCCLNSKNKDQRQNQDTTIQTMRSDDIKMDEYYDRDQSL